MSREAEENGVEDEGDDGEKMARPLGPPGCASGAFWRFRDKRRPSRTVGDASERHCYENDWTGLDWTATRARVGQSRAMSWLYAVVISPYRTGCTPRAGRDNDRPTGSAGASPLLMICFC